MAEKVLRTKVGTATWDHLAAAAKTRGTSVEKMVSQAVDDLAAEGKAALQKGPPSSAPAQVA